MDGQGEADSFKMVIPTWVFVSRRTLFFMVFFWIFIFFVDFVCWSSPRQMPRWKSGASSHRREE